MLLSHIALSTHSHGGFDLYRGNPDVALPLMYVVCDEEELCCYFVCSDHLYRVSIETPYVLLEGDHVSFKRCPIPPKMDKFQAVHVRISEDDIDKQARERWS